MFFKRSLLPPDSTKSVTGNEESVVTCILHREESKRTTVEFTTVTDIWFSVPRIVTVWFGSFVNDVKV